VTLKTSIRNVLSGLAPATVESFRVRRARQHNLRYESRIGLSSLRGEYVRRFGTEVRRGPFAGMRMSQRRSSGAYAAKLMGAYESELYPIIESLAGYTTIVDVGSAEGFYAVGLARKLPAATVWAFDLDPLARNLCKENAALNAVADRVRIRARCGFEELTRLCAPGTLVVSDCEGYEAVLLDPAKAPALVHADILVEVHGLAEPGVRQLLTNRFAASHRVVSVGPSGRDLGKYPELAGYSEADASMLVSDMRDEDNGWLWMKRLPSSRTG